MSKQFTRVFDAFTSPAFIDQFLRITNRLGRISSRFADIAINLGRPSSIWPKRLALRSRRSLAGWRTSPTRSLSSSSPAASLVTFRSSSPFGVDNLKEWGDLLWQDHPALRGHRWTWRRCRSPGLEIIQRLSDAIGGLADKINDPRSDAANWLQRFFDLSSGCSALSPILSALADEFRKTFTEDGLHSVEGFVFFISDILIPAIGDFVTGDW